MSSHVSRCRQLEHELRLADAGEVAVALDEPGNDELAARVDDLGAGSDVALDLVVAADRDDAIAARRRRPAPPAGLVSTVTTLPLVSTSVAG